MKLKSFVLMMAVTGTTVAYSHNHGMHNIVEVAQKNDDFSILVEAVVAADLVDALANTKDLTVFAPTNAAFADLLNQLDIEKSALLANKALLTQVLTHHVIAGAVVKKADVPVGKPVQTLEGDALTVTPTLNIKAGNGDMDSSIVKTDIMASNGVIHVIDKVLLPSNQSIVDIATGNKDFSILVEAVVAAGLVDTLAKTEGLTVFAPTNDAFVALLSELQLTKDALLGNKSLLTKVLTYHVLGNDPVYSSELKDGAVTTLQGADLTFSGTSITDQNGRLANIATADIQASNGVIHVIDKVLLPK